MSTHQARFEVVRSDAGWFARFRAANGRIVWVTETYQRRGKAVSAVELIAGFPVKRYGDIYEVSVNFGIAPETGLIEVRTIDERGATR